MKLPACFFGRRADVKMLVSGCLACAARAIEKEPAVAGGVSKVTIGFVMVSRASTH